MNCQEFESQIEVLARGALSDARTRAAAAAHAESCPACHARLADERALSTGLRALASGMKGAEAPARVEAALLSAFRAGRAASVQAADTGGAAAASNVVRLPARSWSWARTAAVASLAAAASLALFVLVRPGSGVNTPLASHDAAGGGRQVGMLEPPPAGMGGTQAPDLAQHTPPGRARDRSPSPTPGAFGERPTRSSSGPRARAVNAAYNRGAGRPAPAAPAPEVTTEFIALTHGAQYAQGEESHLVRVELPRSALASFGLPVSAEVGGRVKADVLMGEDGTARAIRFIR